MYKLLYENPNEDFFTRLLKIRNINDDILDFLNPSLAKYRIDPFFLDDMEKSITRVMKAIKDKEKIMIFGDYDADGITSSFVLFSFFNKFLKYKNISIRLPSRFEEGYGIRISHIDEIKSLWVKLIITVDNWITAINEVNHANNIWIDMIITDHHKALNEIPQAYGIINPNISSKYWFKWLAWVWVVFKFITAMANKFGFDEKTKQNIINFYLPVVAIWTVADCVPLINENRAFVKKWLELLNTKKNLPKSIENLIKYINIKTKIDTFHIGFMIAPRLNASGRLLSPYKSLNCLLSTDADKQKGIFEEMEQLNTERKKLQDEAFKEAEKNLDIEKNIIIICSDNLWEWIIWLVAGKLTEKYNKPSVVISINNEKWTATASLRWPDYFDVVDLLNQAAKYLINYGWHKQAGWMTVNIQDLEVVINIFEEYTQRIIVKEKTKKILYVDTKIYDWELNLSQLNDVQKLAPFGEWNPEPIFLIEQIDINWVEKVGKNGNWHLKIHAQKNNIKFPVLFRSKWSEVNWFEKEWKKDIIWKVKKDDYNWWFFIDGVKMI